MYTWSPMQETITIHTRLIYIYHIPINKLLQKEEYIDLKTIIPNPSNDKNTAHIHISCNLKSFYFLQNLGKYFKLSHFLYISLASYFTFGYVISQSKYDCSIKERGFHKCL